MPETTMPAAEAMVEADEHNSYELAFHVLPTVAEGEVPSVFDIIKARIIKDEGTIFDEEAPERFDLAYPIIKHLEGKNRTFKSAYFGWVRFNAPAHRMSSLVEEMDTDATVLRHMLIKLTKAEEAHPFRFHEALVSEKTVTTVDESAVVADSDESDTVDEVVDALVIDETIDKDEA